MVNILCIQMEVHGIQKHVMYEIETLSTLTISEELDEKSPSIPQGQNREF